jgi:hypothetical protein
MTSTCSSAFDLTDPDSLKQYLTGNINGIQITEGFLLSAALLMEIPIAMVLLSSVMPHRAISWANIIAGMVMTLVKIGSLFMGSGPKVFHAFYSTVEIECTAFIVWYSWCWLPPELGSRTQTKPRQIRRARHQPGSRPLNVLCSEALRSPG